MQSWITRQNPEDPSSGTLNADQAITLEQAIRGYTLGGAECIGFGWEEKVGSIESLPHSARRYPMCTSFFGFPSWPDSSYAKSE